VRPTERRAVDRPNLHVQGGSLTGRAVRFGGGITPGAVTKTAREASPVVTLDGERIGRAALDADESGLRFTVTAQALDTDDIGVTTAYRSIRTDESGQVRELAVSSIELSRPVDVPTFDLDSLSERVNAL
jgi:hypothetical protein